MRRLDHPEGVAVGRDGTLYAGGEAGQVYRISSDGKKVETLANRGGFCLGITLDQEENIYVCDLGKRGLITVSPRGSVNVLAEGVGDRKFTCPNFSVFDSKGTSTSATRGEWKQGSGVCRLGADGKLDTFAEGPFHFANGRPGTPRSVPLRGGKQSGPRAANGNQAGWRSWHAGSMLRLGPGAKWDGVYVNGNLYVTTYASNRIYRVTPERRVDLLCQDVEDSPLCQPTNCAFGGANFDQLFVGNLGRYHIWVLDLRIERPALWCHRS